MPAPFGPISATRSPVVERERDAVHRDGRPVLDDQPVDLEEGALTTRAPSRGRRSITRSSSRTSVGRPVGDQAPAVEHEHAVGDRADELHVVLDEQDRQPALAQVVEDVLQLPLLGRAQAGDRLVEQEHLRSLRERAGDREQAQLAERERVGGVVGAVARPTSVERAQRLRRGPRAPRATATAVGGCLEEAGARPRVAADHGAREHVELRRPHGLEDDREPGARAAVGRPASEVAAAEEDAPLLGPQEARRCSGRASTCPRRSARSGRSVRRGRART